MNFAHNETCDGTCTSLHLPPEDDDDMCYLDSPETYVYNSAHANYEEEPDYHCNSRSLNYQNDAEHLLWHLLIEVRTLKNAIRRSAITTGHESPNPSATD